jgi:hypothetical protein
MSMPPGQQPEPPTSPMSPGAPADGSSYPQYPAGDNPYPPNPAHHYPGGLASVDGDPLVLPPNAPFSAWFTLVVNLAKRSWKSALIIATLGIGVPRGFANLVAGLTGWGGSWEFGDIGHFFGHLFDGFAIVGLLFTLVAVVAACYLATVGWAAGVWALVHEAGTGRAANVGEAFGYGFKRAGQLFRWTVVAGAAFTVAYALLYVPGIVLAFFICLFGLAGLFERPANPLQRSFELTRNSVTFGPTAGKVGLAFLAYAVLAGIAHGIFGVMAWGFGNAGSISGAGVFDVIATIVVAIGEVFTGPAFAVLLLCLLPTYAELRAKENGGATTAQLQQQLG